jgi:YidC/Oxa1 family membrane protein insertase
MSPGARRIIIPAIVGVLALSVVLVGVFTSPPKPPPPTPAETPPTAAAETPTPDAAPDEPAAEPPAAAGATEPPDDAAETPAPATATAGAVDLTGLRAVAPDRGTSGHDTPPASMGSLDPDVARALVEFSRAGGGIGRITFSDVFETARARRQAAAHRRAVAAGETPSTPFPDDLRYVLQDSPILSNPYRGGGFAVPSFAATAIEIDGTNVNIFDYNATDDGGREYVWAETAPGTFETTVVNEAGTPVVAITRRFVAGSDFDLTLEQRVVNLTGAPLDVRWIQNGPTGLRLDRSRYMDRRRYRFGYLLDPATYPDRSMVMTDDSDLLMERQSILKRWRKAQAAAAEGDVAAQQAYLDLWPNETSREQGYELSWFGATNRYFAMTVHPVFQPGAGSSLAPVVERIVHEVSNPDPADEGNEHLVIFTYLISPSHTIEPGRELALDLGIYAGPLDPSVLDAENQPYRGLSMQNLVLYQMSSWCAICTFQWLAHFLLWFLTLLNDYVLFDWGLAIIGLVVVVRTLLHPLTKKSQISMQRFGKQMQAMKPELDKLQKKFGHDPKRMQQEQMRLMREHGANPLQMLGCLPMFLQTPIWIALYAMLYFAFELRQEPAFFGIFQLISGGYWPFLADLSAADHMLGEFEEPFRFLLWNVTGINVLPILMGVIFYIQQKYMSPPPSPTMTEDQIRQQKIMKVMMVVMFPLMLYSAPSGLTLYILTSSCIGILESRYVRRHISEMDLEPKKRPGPAGAAGRGKKPKDAQGRAFADALERMEKKKRAKRRGPEPKYKKRK